MDYSLHPLSISYTRCMMNESSFLGRPREFSASLQIFIRSRLRRSSDNDRGFLTTARVLEKTCPSLKHLTEEGGGRSKGLLATGDFPVNKGFKDNLHILPTPKEIQVKIHRWARLFLTRSISFLQSPVVLFYITFLHT